MDDDVALAESVARLAAGDLTAREPILERCGERLRLLTRRMLRRFPEVHRHDDTDDVFQQAALRLHEALGAMARRGEPPRSIMALAATQVRRTLLDLARRNRGPWSHAANHDTNVDDGGGHHVERLADAAVEPLDRWEAFHAAVTLERFRVDAWNLHNDVPFDREAAVHLEISPDGAAWSEVMSSTPAGGRKENGGFAAAVRNSRQVFFRARLYETNSWNRNQVHRAQFLRSEPDRGTMPIVTLSDRPR